MKIKLGQLIENFDSKRKPLSKLIRQKMQGDYPYYGAASIFDYVNDYIFNGDYILLGEDGTVINDDGSPILQLAQGKFWANNHTHVLKNNEKLIDFKYLYYLLQITNFSSTITGAVQQKISQKNMNNLIVEYNDDKTIQRKIANKIDVFMNKILVNNQLIEKLYDEVSFLYENEIVNKINEKLISNEWLKGKLGDISEISSGIRPGLKNKIKNDKFLYPIAGAADIIGYSESYNIDEKVIITGRVGTHGILQRFDEKIWASDNTLVIKSKYYEFVYQILKRVNYKAMNRGTTQPLLTQTDLKNIEIIIPNALDLENFENKVGPIMMFCNSLKKENKYLEKIKLKVIKKIMRDEGDLYAL